jgi:NAD(P)H dehydrogenase (quinone)
VPYTQPELNSTSSGGTPYGASHWAGVHGERELTGEEINVCRAVGRRVAGLAVRLAAP